MVRGTIASVSTPTNAKFSVKSVSWRYIYMTVFGLLLLTYLAITFLPKPDKRVLAQYHLTSESYYWILVPLVILLLIAWLAALFGGVVFRTYSSLIKNSKDGGALNTVSLGLLVLAIAQPIISVINGATGLIIRHHIDLAPTFTITNNYISLGLFALSFILIAIGVERLNRQVAVKIGPLQQRAWVLAFIIFSTLYSYFIIIQPIHTPLARRAYFLPDWLLLGTIALPYLCIWYLALYAARQMHEYQKNVRGTIYKSALNYLSGGIVVVIATSILTRSIASISSKLSQLSLTPVLFIIYGLVLINAAGFILIAVGAKKLRAIEEV